MTTLDTRFGQLPEREFWALYYSPTPYLFIQTENITTGNCFYFAIRT